MQAAKQLNYNEYVKYIVNHDIMNCTADGVPANHLYSGRALGMTEPADLLQLHPSFKPLWNDIHAHYTRIGLRHTDQIIWNLDRKYLHDMPGYEPSVFFFGPNEYDYWSDQRWFDAVDFINSKNNFMYLAEELFVDVPNTLCFESIDEISDEDLENISYPCYLKAAISVAGVGIYKCDNRSQLIESIKFFAPNIPVQIQEEVKTSIFLNLQYRVTGNQLERLTASEQILDGYAHQGNRVPASHEPWDTVEPMARWLKARGMRGIFAFDVAVVQSNHGLRFLAIECNPRFNGASYPTLISEKLGINQWASISLSTRHRQLSELDLEGIEYNARDGNGVILVNWGTILEGKLMVLLAGNPEQQRKLEVELRQRL